MSIDRKIILLKACLALLEKIGESYMLDETVKYDGASCDGYCLMDDIKSELGEL